jgi:hypothetical protein
MNDLRNLNVSGSLKHRSGRSKGRRCLSSAPQDYSVTAQCLKIPVTFFAGVEFKVPITPAYGM